MQETQDYVPPNRDVGTKQRNQERWRNREMKQKQAMTIYYSILFRIRYIYIYIYTHTHIIGMHHTALLIIHCLTCLALLHYVNFQ